MNDPESTDINESENNAAIYHRVYPDEGLIESANTIWGLLQDMDEKHPEKNAILFLDIDGHRTTLPDDADPDEEPGYDREMVVLMNHVCIRMFSPFLHQFISPLGSYEFNADDRQIPERYTPSTCELFIEHDDDTDEWEIAIYDPDDETPK